MDQLRLAAARYRLGAETADSLRALGEHLLAEGHDEAVKLAILESDLMYDAGPVFERLCAELGQPIPLVDQAIDIATAAILREIVSKSVAPEAGLRSLIYDVHPELSGDVKYVGDSHGLQDLIGAYWGYGGYEDLRSRPTEASIDGKFGEDAIPLLDEQVRRSASEWLAAHGSILPS